MVRCNDMRWMRRSVVMWLMGTLSLCALPSVFGQAAAPDLEVDAVSARSSTDVEVTRVDVYTRVPYSSLRFLATNNAFEASYEVTIGVHELEGDDRAGNLVQSRIFEQNVRAADFAQTQTDQLFDRTIQTLELAPGRYLLEFQVDDRASNRSFVKELPIRVRDMNRSFVLSDLILIDAYDAEANSITPTVSSSVGSDQDHFNLFYEIYADGNREVRIRREMAHIPRSSGLPSVKSLLGFGAGDDLSDADISYQETLPQTVRSGRNQYVVEMPINDLEVGDYVARVIVEDLSGNELDRAERAVTLQWTGLAEHVRDLDAAIDQLSYIAKRDDLEYIRSGRTEQERLARFREFWDRRDPTPNSERNERMEEYYYRIAYANNEYGNFGNGWQTDRGQVMVLFGEPDHVDRHPFNFNVKPYEVWYYYRIGRRFVFIDDTGLGDYELLVPYWDDRTRLR